MSELITACQICGKAPELVSEEFAPDHVGYALWCNNEDHVNDTHWQNSATEAVRIWNTEQPCTDIRGGQGDESDDHIN